MVDFPHSPMIKYDPDQEATWARMFDYFKSKGFVPDQNSAPPASSDNSRRTTMADRRAPISPRMLGQNAYYPETTTDYWAQDRDPDYYSHLSDAALRVAPLLPTTAMMGRAGEGLAAIGRTAGPYIRGKVQEYLPSPNPTPLATTESGSVPSVGGPAAGMPSTEFAASSAGASGYPSWLRDAADTVGKVFRTTGFRGPQDTGDSLSSRAPAVTPDDLFDMRVPLPPRRPDFYSDQKRYPSAEDYANYKAQQARSAVTSTPTTPVVPPPTRRPNLPSDQNRNYQSNNRPVLPAPKSMNAPTEINWGNSSGPEGSAADFFRADKAMRDAQAAGQNTIGMASGGPVDRASRIAREKAAPCHHGIINMAVGGRTDHIPMNVLEGSYVLPADIVSGLGEGNTLAGTKIINSMFHTGPYGTKVPSFSASPRFPAAPPHTYQREAQSPPAAANGGRIHRKPVPIIAAGGEYVIHPDVVAHLGDGDMDKGHEYLDHFVKYVRKETAKTLGSLPGPRRD